ncbi:GGDEF domain-containing protein [Novosphingobium lindaniclasticum]
MPAGEEEAFSMRFYQATTFVFPRRYEWRILLACLGAAGLPLVAAAGFQAVTGIWRTDLLGFIAAATAVGAIIALSVIHALLAPIREATAMLRAAQAGEHVGPVPTGGDDLAGRLLHGVALAVQQSAARTEPRLETAERDALTGLRNRFGFLDSAERVLIDGGNAVLALIDIDRFATINDRFGRATGDSLLREVARRLEHGVRRSDLPSRRNGGEFAILFPDTMLDEARLVMERLQASIALDPTLRGDEWPVTLSCGLAPVRSFAQLEDATRIAGNALMAARNGGRNNVRISRNE